MRYFTPSPRTPTQLLRDLCEFNGFPMPTALQVEAEREDVRDHINQARADGDTDRVKALEDANADLLNEDRESVLVRWLKELREAAELGDQSAATQAREYQRELDEIRAYNTDDGEAVDVDHEDTEVKS